MGELISLADRRRSSPAAGARIPSGGGGPVTFSFDLASPYTYLAAERVDRMFTDVRWAPVVIQARPPGSFATGPGFAATCQHAEQRAQALRMPLVWPERMPVSARRMMRIAAHAVTEGRGAAFVLAASRLTFCGGFDLDDPEILAEASAAAGLGLDDCLRAAANPALDWAMEDAGRLLVAQGAHRLPALKVGRMLFCGEDRLPEAMAAARGHARRHDADPSAPTSVA